MRRIALTFVFLLLVSCVLYVSAAKSEEHHEACSNMREGPEVQEREVLEREPIEGPGPTPPPTPPRPPSAELPKPNPAWGAVVGYTQSFETCRNLCSQYIQSGCSATIAKQYCNAAISVDLGKDGAIQQGTKGLTPAGGYTCENALRCFDVVTECKCGSNVLNINTCVTFYLEQVKQAGTVSAVYSLVHDYLAPGCVMVGA